jgi:hypothetical protein
MPTKESEPESLPGLLITDLTDTSLSDQRPPRPPPTNFSGSTTNPADTQPRE